ncbi:unnamed protein product [Ectocarpus sp. 4 AP-2014]
MEVLEKTKRKVSGLTLLISNDVVPWMCSASAAASANNVWLNFRHPCSRPLGDSFETTSECTAVTGTYPHGARNTTAAVQASGPKFHTTVYCCMRVQQCTAVVTGAQRVTDDHFSS